MTSWHKNAVTSWQVAIWNFFLPNLSYIIFRKSQKISGQGFSKYATKYTAAGPLPPPPPSLARVNDQVEYFTSCILNVFLNFVPSKLWHVRKKKKLKHLSEYLYNDGIFSIRGTSDEWDFCQVGQIFYVLWTSVSNFIKKTSLKWDHVFEHFAIFQRLKYSNILKTWKAEETIVILKCLNDNW